MALRAPRKRGPRASPVGVDYPCPCCGYNLRGLPRMHNCPECGFEYDPQALILALGGKHIHWGEYRSLIAVVGGIFALVVVLTGRGSPDFAASSVPGWLYWSLFFAIGITVVIRMGRRLGRKQELRINHKGVQFVDPALPRGLIPWERIGEAECLEDGDALVIKDKSGEAVVTCEREVIGERSDVEHCARQINALRDKYHDLNRLVAL